MPLLNTAPLPGTKWIRQFWMQVQGKTRLWTITSPLTLELDIERANVQSVARFSLKVYNLSVAARSDIYRDQSDQSPPLRPVYLNAGYLSWLSEYGPPNLQAFPQIARGLVFQAFSTRVGPSWVTTITGWDGGYDQANASINAPFAKGVPWNERVRQVAAAMPNLRNVYISPLLTAPVARGAVYSGKPWDILVELAGYANAQLFIDLGVLYMIPQGQTVPGLTGGLTEINTNYGLLNTPVKQQFRVSFDMLFEPRLLVGQQVSLVSEEPENNGVYSVQAVAHRGTISDGVEGDCRTSVTLWNPKANPPGGN